jgi:hypothetical protein
MLHYFQLKDDSDGDAKDTKQKGLKTKHALKAMRIEIKQVRDNMF